MRLSGPRQNHLHSVVKLLSNFDLQRAKNLLTASAFADSSTGRPLALLAEFSGAAASWCLKGGTSKLLVLPFHTIHFESFRVQCLHFVPLSIEGLKTSGPSCKSWYLLWVSDVKLFYLRYGYTYTQPNYFTMGHHHLILVPHPSLLLELQKLNN